MFGKSLAHNLLIIIIVSLLPYTHCNIIVVIFNLFNQACTYLAAYIPQCTLIVQVINLKYAGGAHARQRHQEMMRQNALHAAALRL